MTLIVRSSVLLRAGALVTVCAFAGLGCAPAAVRTPDNVTVGARVPNAWPTPRIEVPIAKPQIQAMWFSSLDVALGSDWDGEFIASSNTASIEVATNLFAFSVPRPQVGHFQFRFHMIDAPAFFIRPYALHVTARNTAGEQSEEDVPFRIRGRE